MHRRIGSIVLVLFAVGCSSGPETAHSTPDLANYPRPATAAPQVAVRGMLGEDVELPDVLTIAVQSARELPEATAPRPAGFRVIEVAFEVMALRDLVLGPENFSLSDDTRRAYGPVDGSGQPAIALPTSLAAGSTSSGHATFQVPIGGNLVLQYAPEGSKPVLAISLTAIAAAPTPTPRPTLALTGQTTGPASKPAARPAVLAIKASFFGSGVGVKTYRVKGNTPSAISRSISANGPYDRWLRSNAEGLTKAKAAYRFHLESYLGSCQVVIDARPAVKISYTIIVPRWRATSATPVSTIQWWNGEIRDVATHERVHVTIFRAAAKKLNAVVASSTCGNVRARLKKVWAATQRQQCEFDMKEYGAAAGLSLKACLAQ